MTHKENIKAILECYFTGFKEEIIDSACDRILEQQPCEDCISREAMLLLQVEYAEDMSATKFWRMRDDIRSLPSVTPKEKTGRWIRKVAEIENDDLRITYECSECKVEQLFKENYCPDCGARMFDEVSK